MGEAVKAGLFPLSIVDAEAFPSQQKFITFSLSVLSSPGSLNALTQRPSSTDA